MKEYSLVDKNKPIPSDISWVNKQVKLAFEDLKQSVIRWRLWLYLGWNDIKQRYRGSLLGPLWITASMLIFVTAFSLVYSKLFHQPLKTYIPFLTTGYLVWLLISMVLTESCNIFVEAKDLITEIKLPYLIYVCRCICRNVIIFFHNAIVFIGVALFFHINVNWNILYFIPGMVAVLLSLTSISMLLTILGAKFRDLPPIITSLIQVTFFVSPISWMPKLIGESSIVIALNPVTYYLDLVRSPLLGEVPHGISWVVAFTLTSLIFVIAFFVFVKFRRRIPFWL